MPRSLPIDDRGSELEELSFRALQSAFPVTDFIIHDERGSKDRGSDASIEIKKGGCATNMRCQVQLKATDGQKINKDGSVSHPIAGYNLNYLLNGGNALYILYIEPRNELRFVWSRDAVRGFKRKDPNWLKAETATLRFRRKLSIEAVSEIATRIEQEADLDRRFREVLEGFDGSSTVSIPVNPSTLKTIDPHALADLLEKAGCALIATGDFSGVLDALALVDRTRAQTPRLKLVAGYGHYAQGRYHQALADVSEAKVREGELRPDEREQLNHVLYASRRQVGLMSAEAYGDWLSDRASVASGLLGLQYRLEQVKGKLHTARNIDEFQTLLDEAADAVSTIQDHPSAPSPLRLSAALVHLYIQGGLLPMRHSHAVQLAHAQQRMGVAVTVAPMNDARRAIVDWERSMAEAVTGTTEIKSTTLYAEALYTRGFVRTNLLASLALSTLSNPVEIAVGDIGHAEQDLKEAIALYVQIGSVEGEVRSTIALAELYALGGDAERAKQVAATVQGKAEAMSYAGLSESGRRHLDGGSYYRDAVALWNEGLSTDEDFLRAAESDDAVDRAASFLLEALGLPKNRRPILYRDLLSLRQIAQERIDFCQDIELFQGLKHTFDPLTHYAQDPDRSCHCNRHHYQSKIRSTDWTVVIKGLKAAYCSACPDRCPKKEAAV